jgi:HlyD family secretion protein
LKKLLLILLVPVVAFLVWAWQRRGDAPQVNFVKVKRETLVSILSTNGKVEPYSWQSVRSERPGLVTSVPVQEGQTVAVGAVLAGLSDPSVKSEIIAAESRLTEARAGLSIVETGGKAAELSEIESNLQRARFDRQEADRELASLKRLLAQQATTQAEVTAAQAKVRQAELAAEALEKRRSSLVGAADRTIAQARVRDAEAALAALQQRASSGVVRTPVAGVVYQLSVRPGTYLALGDPVASVGRLDRVRVRVYVDEPELGRISEGQPVTITWDALPGKEWSGIVEKKPVSIQTLGTRQVGEVICTIENPGRELIPGTNVNAGIKTAVAQNALVLPKEVLRRDSEGTFVFVLRNGIVARQVIATGTASVTRVEATRGVAEGDAVALPTDTPIKAGDKVNAVFQ